jgi:glycine/serine hydroxymethyltransferase
MHYIPNFRPGGIRLGSAALTTREFKEKDFETVAQFIHEGDDIMDNSEFYNLPSLSNSLFLA